LEQRYPAFIRLIDSCLTGSLSVRVLDVGSGGVYFLLLTWMYEQGRVALLSPEQDAAVHRDHLPS
jgi:hypothetical protein